MFQIPRVGSPQVTLSISVKLHWRGVVWEPPSQTMGSQPKGSPPSNLSPQQYICKYHRWSKNIITRTPKRLIGPANEATIIVEGQQFSALIDSGSQLSMMSESLVQALKLPIHKLSNLIEAEVSGRGTTPYTGYVEARLTIPGIERMDKDSLFMITNDSPYTQRVPIQLGMLHIGEALQLATEEERKSLPPAWWTLSKLDMLKEPDFYLGQVKGKVKLTNAVTM